MAEKAQTFAFLVGEVSPAFYGRLDLQKYPLGMAEVENFFVDYHGGLLNRAGSEFIAMLPEAPHKFARFRTKEHDLVLLFTENKMRVLRDGKFVHTAANSAGTILNGVVTTANTLVVDQTVWVSGGGTQGYFSVSSRTAGDFTIDSPVGQPVPDGPVVWAPVYQLVTTFSDADLAEIKVAQDLNQLVITRDTRLPTFITRVSDASWTLSTFSNSLPAAPTGLTGVASGAGTASVGFAVTAVVDGVESASSVELVSNSIVNYSVTTGHFTLSWSAVPGAQRYNVYRSLIYPTTYAAGAQLGYVGYTTGLSFIDRNITADNSKTLPFLADFFAGSNFPAVYSRFQQRGVYAGLANEPLTVVGSIAADKGRFSLSFPPIATDSYSYTLDSESERPIKHMLSLRYGLMLFTDDGITQLRGGESTALTAVSAIAEPQSYVSVSDLDPIAVNMDVLFMTSLNSELNQMVYTEYTNSFKMQDILVLSTHLFGPENQAVEVTWAAEPYKLLHFVREDGERITLTYERNLEVYGWSRYATQGQYLSVVAVTEDDYTVCYQSVRRKVNALKSTEVIDVIFLEREKPRNDKELDRMWYVDGGLERPLIRRDAPATLYYLPDSLGAQWEVSCLLLDWAVLGNIVYIAGGIFRVTAISGPLVSLVAIVTPELSRFSKTTGVRVEAGDWGYNYLATTLEGLWWLEGQKVSVLFDGNAALEKTVVNGVVDLGSEAAYIVAGLAYSAKARTLPLSLPNFILGGSPLSLRSLNIRQLNTRGLSVGSSFENLEELPSRRNELWDSPLTTFTELTEHELWGAGGWTEDAQVCFQQSYPLPVGIIGFTFDLDVGD